MDTDNIQQSWKGQRGCIQRFICKMSVNQLATGRYMKRMRFWPSDQCPHCMANNEITLHVLQCKAPSAVELLHERLQLLLNNLKNFPTKPEILQGINAIFHVCIQTPETEPYPGPTDGIANVLSEPSVVVQLTLPIHEFLRGRIVTKWRDEQALFLTRIRSR